MSSLTEKEKQILNSHREILWLQRQIEEYEQETEGEIDLAEIATEELSDQVDQYNNHISTLRSQLDSLVQMNEIKERLLVNMDAHYFSVKALYPKLSNHHSNALKKSTEEKINQRDARVVEFMKLLQEFSAKKNELIQIQRKLIQQHIKNKEISKEIQELKEHEISQVQDNHEQLSQGITEAINQLLTVRGVLLGLILESDIDWEGDDRWRETVLRIGSEPPTSTIFP
ncbi:uncharacterized protein RHIMIDRAFT_238498 [Rhizopus microsporus ATCC 52813]|uniref:Centromere protein H C-terminal domain-containing protein n=1 Tax=Rhizopus microsporus ATCC 52813 TaxID=1340429 RepID=A0A2G4SSX0_RHIZD|nr:uncharacterized protein RHIMIDRAFT_238498 [Rhizopus microsporus ATCC 52813]PHZ11842.1 hypothetical protein RHIMIDRAFT_238498 [Rhizopus microsporus ATCC 52813]